MKVLIVPNFSRADALEGARALEGWLLDQGVDVLWAHDKKLFPGVDDSAEGCDLVVSLGGDGTLLRAARIVGYEGVPIVGISYGHLGFLTAAGPEDLVATVEDGAGNMIEFDVSVSGKHIDRLRGDGFVVSTATGSTGYALASGGPIVTPEFTGMVCVPIAPHTIMARAFLTSPSDVVEIEMSPERPSMRHFFVDGQPIAREKHSRGVRATVRRGRGDVILLDRSAQSFYDSVSRVFYGQVGK